MFHAFLRTITVGVVAAFVGLSALPAFVQAQAKQDPPAKPEPLVIKLQAAEKGKHGGQEVLMVSGVEPLSGQQRTFAVENQKPQNPNAPQKYDPNPDIKAEVDKVKPGEYLRIEPKAAGGAGGGYGRARANNNAVTWIDKAEKYTPVDHEEEPNTFILFSGYDDKLGAADVYKVELQKFGRIFDCYVQMVNVDKQLVPDPVVVAAAKATEKKTLIEATVKQQGNHLMVMSLDPYQAPRAATFTKMSEVDTDGVKIPAVELSENGTAVTLMLPGKLASKKWLPDPTLYAAARRTKPNTPVIFKTRDAEQKSYVRMLAPAPKETQKKDTLPPEMKK